jgi:tetratricopeptide (TPR) repeat protein
VLNGVHGRPAPLILALTAATGLLFPLGAQGAQTAEADTLSAIGSDLEANRYREALASARHRVRENPDDALAWTYLGMASVRLGEMNSALEAFERAIVLDPRDPRPFFDAALLYANRNNLDKALDRYQRGLAIDRRNETAQFNYGRLLLLKGRQEEAEKAFRRTLEINPRDAGARVELSRLALARHDFASAVDSARQAAEFSPGSLEANLALAEAYISANQDVQAMEHLENLLPRFNKSAAFHYTLGIAQYRSKKFHPAVASFRQAVELDPRLDLAQFLLASALLGTGDLDGAETGFKAAIAIRPDQPLYRNYLARVYEHRGPEYRVAALAATREVLRLNPTDVEGRRRMAQWAKEDGDLPRAQQLLEEVVRDDPSYSPARVLLAVVYHRLRLREKAEEQERVVRRLEADGQNRPHAPYILE